jgi:hypothetical protein
MGPTSKMVWLAFGLLLVLAAARQSLARTDWQARPEESGSNHQTGSSDPKPDDKVAPGARAPGPAGQSGRSAPDTVPDRGVQFIKEKPDSATGAEHSARKSQKATKDQPPASSKPAKPAVGNASPIHSAAQQTLDNLDVAIRMLQSGVLARGSPAGQDVADITHKRELLQAQVRIAADDRAWTEVSKVASALMAETLQGLDQNSGSPVDSYGAKPSREVVPERHDPGTWRQSQLPLYVAGLSLTFSVLGLGSGWFLVRREVNKALIDAGLL